MMNEIARQKILSSMGVDSYFPRFILPQAPESKSCRLPEGVHWPLRKSQSGVPGNSIVANSSASSNTVVKKADQDKVIQSAEQARQKISLDLEKSSTKPANKRPEQAVAADVKLVTENSPSESLRFKLALVCLDNGVFILNQLPTMGNGQLARNQQTLLWRILHSLGCGISAGEVKIHLFSWPLAFAGVDDSPEAAKSALHAFLETNSKSCQLDYLLLLGDALLIDLFSDGMSIERGQLKRFERLDCSVLSTYSLDQLLKVSMLKRDVWKDLAALRNSLPAFNTSTEAEKE